MHWLGQKRHGCIQDFRVAPLVFRQLKFRSKQTENHWIHTPIRVWTKRHQRLEECTYVCRIYIVVVEVHARGRKSVLLFLLGYIMAFWHETSSDLGDTCSRTCPQTMEPPNPLYIVCLLVINFTKQQCAGDIKFVHLFQRAVVLMVWESQNDNLMQTITSAVEYRIGIKRMKVIYILVYMLKKSFIHNLRTSTIKTKVLACSKYL